MYLLSCKYDLCLQDSLISNLRVTSLLAVGNRLYIGTGGGDLFQFDTVAGVADPEASIRSILAERGRITSRKRKPSDTDSSQVIGGGLITKSSLLDQGEKETIKPATPELPSYYRARSRSRFGRTLRRGRPEADVAGHSMDSVYKLEFRVHSKLGSSANEPTRVLLQVR